MKSIKGERPVKNMCGFLSLLLAAVLALTLCPSPALAGEAQGGRAVRWEKDELVVGHPTAIKGDFFTEMFGSGTADVDVRTLLHGYNLIHLDQNQGVYLFDESVVKDAMALTNEVGDKTYFIALYDDLYYSDGTSITAWDYAFSFLLTMSREIGEIGGKISRAEHILGGGDYLTGQAETLAGVRVLDERQLSVTLDHEFLPFFYELSLLMCSPYPIREIAPGCRVYDDGNGVYIGNEDRTNQQPVFTAELLKKTLLDPQTGYRSHPRVVSGPYRLLVFDGVTAHFEINEAFKGVPKTYLEEAKEPNDVNVVKGQNKDLDGAFGTQPKLVRPTIRKLAFTRAENDTLVTDLQEGRLDLVNKVVYGGTIREGLEAKVQYADYPRVGLSELSFTCERPTVREKEVRQAIAWCMDRDRLIKSYCGDYGLRVDGYYGIDQWEYLLVTHKMNYPVNFEDEAELQNTDLYAGVDMHTEGDWQAAGPLWKGLSLNKLTKYYVNPKKANALLDQAGWTLNEAGEAYQAQTGAVRCKLVDGELVKLELTMMYAEGSHIVDDLEKYFINNLAQVGIRLTLVPVPMEDLFSSYYRETDRGTDMIFLGTNAQVVANSSFANAADADASLTLWSSTYSDDEELYYRAVSMRRTDPKDVYDYVTKWVAFQERYNEVLPALPIYSNIYYDLWTEGLTDYYVTAHVSWAQAILEAKFTGREDAELADAGRPTASLTEENQ